jgi:hypothetical protein
MLQLLSEMREQLNTRFRQRIAVGARIDPAFWLRHVEQFIAPIVEKVHGCAPDRSKETLLALYEVGLDLAALGHFSESGGSKPLVELWQETLPSFVQVMSLSPKVVLSSLCNAVLYLDQYSHSKAEAWLGLLRRTGVWCQSPEQLLHSGKFLAWTAGLAHFRHGALEIASELPWRVLLEPLGAPPSFSEEETRAFLKSLAINPWSPLVLNTDIREVARCGNFRGLDGPFFRPPIAYLRNGSIHVTDEQCHWRLHADRFGHIWHQIPNDHSKPTTTTAKSTPRITEDGTLCWGQDRHIRCDLLNATSQCFDGCTLAVTIANSYHVYLFARPM